MKSQVLCANVKLIYVKKTYSFVNKIHNLWHLAKKTETVGV
jgi:hypothetical protein